MHHSPTKDKKHCVKLTTGGNLINYLGKRSTLIVGIVTIKTYWNSVISVSNGRYSTIGIKDFYLNTKLTNFEYMCIPYNILPKNIIIQYNLNIIVADDGFMHIEILSGICGLLQVGQLAYGDLIKHLEPYGYTLVIRTLGL